MTVDTLRADRLSVYGYDRRTSPFLEQLARHGVVFEELQSTSSWTAPAMASLFTGTWPRDHGVIHGHKGERGRVRGQEILDEDLEALAEHLEAVGYRTFGVSSNGHLRQDLGFAQGFQEFRYVGWRSSPRVESVVEEWAPRLRGSTEPFFLWVHLLDPHSLYEARAPWIESYFPEPRDDLRWLEKTPSHHYHRDGRELSDRELAYVEALYDSEIRAVDASIERIYQLAGIDIHDLVVVTADHGEELMDRGRFGHGVSLFQETVRIPLILRLPGGRLGGRRIAEPASLIELAATILTVASGEARTVGRGHSLLASARSKEEPLFMEHRRSDRRQIFSVRRGRFKLIQDDKGEKMLFDLVEDPREQDDVCSQPGLQGTCAALVEELARYRSVELRASERRPVDDEQLRELQSLGYLD